MPYVQNTESDVSAMLAAIGVKSIDDLFADIPAHLRLKAFTGIAPAKGEADVLRDLADLTDQNEHLADRVSFLGAGIERHFIPHIVDHISLDGNFITAYTPYQPEVSQGTLTAIFQFQTMMSALTGLPVSNASLYDGASAVAEAAMVAFHHAAKVHRKENRKRVIVPRSLHPEYRGTLKTYAWSFGLELVEVGLDLKNGLIDRAAFSKAVAAGGVVAGLLPMPSFLGTVEDLTPLAEELHKAGAAAIGVCSPLALSIFKSPGEAGCDIAVGEGQTLGCYQALGGPAFGYFSCSQDFIRNAPGRIVSQTVDRDGKRAFCLALATREQHIRREKATSNICTNQALMALRATLYMGSLGKQGFVELGQEMASITQFAAETFEAAGIKRRFAKSPVFNELVIEAPTDHAARAKEIGIQSGLDLGRFYPELEGCVLVTFTELHTRQDIEDYAACLAG